MAPAWLTERAGVVRLSVRVQPMAPRSRIVSAGPEELKIALAAPPLEGRANAELIDFLATVLDVPRRSLTLEHGLSGRHKRLAVTGLSGKAVLAALRMKVAP